MKKFLITLLITQAFMSFTHAGDRSSLNLMGQVRKTTKTQVDQISINDSQSLIVFSSQSNSKDLANTQKYEVDGLEQEGLVASVKSLNSQRDGIVRYEMLLNHSPKHPEEHAPIFIKISVN